MEICLTGQERDFLLNRLREKSICCTGLVLIVACMAIRAAVVKTSAYSNYAEALKQCKSGDALVFNGGTAVPLRDPPDDLQIIGGSATWTLTKDVSDLVFFNHGAKITQTAGIMRRSFVYPGGNGCSFTGLDSCMFRPGELYGWASKEPRLLINGFLRATSVVDLRTGNTSSNNRWQIGHATPFVINAAHPVGDGRNSFIGHWLCWGQVDWINLSIVNGRGITVGHFNSEYPTWADPMVVIDNGYECTITAFTPGGYEPSGDWVSRTSTIAYDGTTAYQRLAYRNGLYRIAGQANGIVGGISYKSFQSVVTGKPWLDLNVRDPYFAKWNAYRVTGINFAPAKGQISFNDIDWVTWKDAPLKTSMLVSENAACTTFFADENGQSVTSGLKGKPLRCGPRIRAPYFPRLPALRGGPGTDMTGKSGGAVLTALNAGDTVFLGAGTYSIPGTIHAGKVYGAGIDKTILEFPTGSRCFDGGGGVGAYNLTVKSGKIGYAQTSAFNVGSFANVRFTGQSICGIALGNAQNVYFGNLEFDNCNTGVMACRDGIPCGEDMTPDGASMIDKVCFYGCIFKNMREGIALGIGNNGYSSFYGCTFEGLESGIRIWRSLGGNGKCQGFHMSGCTFNNCKQASTISGSVDIDNCIIKTNSAGARGFAGSVNTLVNCSITGCDTAATVGGYGVVSFVESDGILGHSSTTWIGGSVFRNMDVRNGARIGATDLTQWVNTDLIAPDNTPPSAPTNIQVSRSGSNNTITWAPSQDAQSGVAFYLIERNGSEIGRTGYSYNMDPSKQASQFATGFKQVTRYVDLNAAEGTGYNVVAVNSALIRSDGAMARIRTWPHAWTVQGDSAFVPPGALTPYTAVRFYEEGKEIVSVRSGKLRHETNQPLLQRAHISSIFDLRGRKLTSIPEGSSIRSVLMNQRLPGGVFIIPELRRKIVTGNSNRAISH